MTSDFQKTEENNDVSINTQEEDLKNIDNDLHHETVITNDINNIHTEDLVDDNRICDSKGGSKDIPDQEDDNLQKTIPKKG